MKPSFTTIVIGDSRFFEEVGIPLAHCVEQSLSEAGVTSSSVPDDQILALDYQPKAEAVLISFLFGVLGFAASWAATTLLNEVYESKVRPALRTRLKSLGKPRAKNAQAFLVGIWVEDVRVLVAVLIEGETSEQIASLIDRALKLLRRGVEEAARSKPTCMVQLYRADVQLDEQQPRSYTNLMAALKENGF